MSIDADTAHASLRGKARQPAPPCDAVRSAGAIRWPAMAAHATTPSWTRRQRRSRRSAPPARAPPSIGKPAPRRLDRLAAARCPAGLHRPMRLRSGGARGGRRHPPVAGGGLCGGPSRPALLFQGRVGRRALSLARGGLRGGGAGCRNVILYNIPSLTGVTIGASLVGRLRREFPEIVAGVKDSGGDWQHTLALLAEHRDLAILVGHEGHLAQAVRRGASGAISGVANIAPEHGRELAAGTREPADRLRSWSGCSRMPVVPALKAILAAQTGDADWSTSAPSA